MATKEGYVACGRYVQPQLGVVSTAEALGFEREAQPVLESSQMGHSLYHFIGRSVFTRMIAYLIDDSSLDKIYVAGLSHGRLFDSPPTATMTVPVVHGGWVKSIR